MEEHIIKEKTKSSTSQISLAAMVRHCLLPLVVLTCGIALAYYLLKSTPEAQPQKRPPATTLVEVKTVVSGPQRVILNAMGEVIPAREIELRPRVSGKIIDMADDFVPGGFFAAGEPLLQVDPADYRLMVRQRESEVARVESDIDVEMGNQRIAQREYDLLGEAVSSEERTLILRKPQLEKLQAARDIAQAQLDQAKLNLERTEITAPFNSFIGSKKVDIGAKVNESTVLAHLVGSDAFWLLVSLPVEQLQWLVIPSRSSEEGALVRIFAQDTADVDGSRVRFGRVVRLAASLEEQGRMAQVLIRVDDPLGLLDENRNKPRLLLGSYVRTELEGVTIDAAVSLDRSHLHEGNTVWLLSEDETLEIRRVEIAFRDRKQVIVTAGLRDGERLITSTLVSPVAGIALQEVGSVPEMSSAGVGAGSSRETGYVR